MSSGGNPKEAKNFMNCVHEPIISDQDDDIVLDFIPPPELHLMLEIVNTLFDHMLKEFNDGALAWASYCHVQREIRNCGSVVSSFNGNACKTLLNKVDSFGSTCHTSKFSTTFEKL